MSDDIVLETRALTKAFRGFVAVNNVNLQVRRGTIHAPRPQRRRQDHGLQPARPFPDALGRLDSLRNAFGSLVTIVTGAIFVVCVLLFRKGILGEIHARLGARRAR